ncbi:MAG: hypothetical protein WAW67_06860 [Candidatus Omnitrophota bacterium]
MFNKPVRILNFDDSILKQKNLLSRYKTEVIDLKGLAPQARYFLNAKIRSLIERRIKSSAKDSITFLGSGDFHHISEILISQFNEPISCISFDFHPDWEIVPPRFGCGSWVSEVLRRKNILKFILVGASSNDLDSFNIQNGNLDSLKDDRVEIYPYAHQASLTFFKKVPRNVSIGVLDGVLFERIYWHELKDRNLNEFFPGILRRIPQKKVYISIDKDCLKNDFSLTNWEEGMFSLDELLLMLKLIKDNMDIVGVDITGDYSPIVVEGLFKKAASYFDHPKKLKAKILPEATVTAINEDTNLKILQLFNSEV